MFKIGEFSRFSRVSVKMLRYYDELGLFKPARVDPDTGYRYYSAGQLPRLNRLVALKDLGFRLEQIDLLLDEDLTTEQLRGMLKLRRAELEVQMHEMAEQLKQVDARLIQLEQGESGTQAVVLRAVTTLMVAAIRQPVNEEDASIALLFEELEAYVAQYWARAPLPPLVLYHNAEFSEQGEDCEVMVPVLKPLPTNARVAIRELPGFDSMACLIHTGRYEDLPQAFSVLLGWIEHNGYTIAGPTRELYLRFGADQAAYRLPEAYLTENAADFVTELQIPVKSVERPSRA